MQAVEGIGRIKGIALVRLVKALRAQKEQVLPSLAPELHRYFDSKFRVWPSEWYPETDLLGLLRVAVETFPNGGRDPWEWLGRQGARLDFEGLYAPMVKPGDPAATLCRYPRTWRLYHDEGRVEVTLQGEGAATIEIGHYLTTFDGFCRLQSGHFAELLAVAGATDNHVRNLRVHDSDGPARWQASWSLDSA